MELPFAESWKIKMVEPIRKSTRQEREQWLKEAHYNVFQLKSEQVYIDLITDSGTGAMSDRQWAGIMLGDESYAGASSFFNLKEVITRLTGFEYIIPTHQGRAAENVLFSHLVHAGDIVPGNSHFDTTKGHIESRKAIALDCTIDEARQTQLEIPFKGNVDPAKLEKALEEHNDRIPFIIVTITNNTAGGQPVSMQNLREVRNIADKYNKPVLFDSARFAENAYFIKTREEGYKDKSIKEITKEMFALADGMTMSAKKDGIVNMGGFPAFGKKDEYLAIISLGSSLGDGFVRKVATSGNDQYAVMDAGERGGNAVSAAPGRSGNFVQFIMVFCFLDTGWPHPATQSSRRNNQPVICCLLCIAYSFIARNVEAGIPASFTRFALVKGCQP